ncbi:MAG: hypothetical protein ACREMQ_03230, partial [Longimicrobiales bacterium]
VLERSADAGAAGWVDRLNKRTTVREIVRAIAKSPEHLQRFGNQARENVVVDMYRHLLNRGPDAEGLRNAVDLVSRRGVACNRSSTSWRTRRSTGSSSAIGRCRARAFGSAPQASSRVSRAATCRGTACGSGGWIRTTTA